MSSVDRIFGEVDAHVDDSGFVAENGTYVLLGVNNFNGAASPAPGMSSYLRLGAADSRAGNASAPVSMGEDLAALVTGFADDQRNHGVEADGRDPQDPSLPPIQSALNEASLMDGPTLNSVDPATHVTRRALESQRLHHRGGWRDHSDGNRITTTRGDKVEVIRGNYKLLVLGRQSLDGIAAHDARQSVIENAAGVDMSGGLTDTDSGDLAAPDVEHMNVEYTWGADSDGTWSWTQTTTVGARAPVGQGNYRIINRTWVDYQEDELGSETKPVSFIGQKTWASSMSSETHVSGVNSTETYGAVVNTSTIVGMTNDLTIAVNTNAARLVGAATEADIGGMIALMQLAAFIPSLIIGVALDEHVGAHIDNHEGSHNELHTGMHTDMHTGVHFDTHAGLHMDVHSGLHATIDSTQIAITAQNIMSGTDVIATRSGNDITLTNMSMRSTIAQSVALAGLHIIN